MEILGWMFVGLLAGGLARMATGSEKRGCIATIVIGILGALIGGALFSAAGSNGIHGGIGSVFVAFIGACALLFIMQALGVTKRRR
jgi:uncharacterized membrane protein YeaQ/YmgE (transglycosylase-associated protein family)